MVCLSIYYRISLPCFAITYAFAKSCEQQGFIVISLRLSHSYSTLIYSAPVSFTLQSAVLPMEEQSIGQAPYVHRFINSAIKHPDDGPLRCLTLHIDGEPCARNHSRTLIPVPHTRRPRGVPARAQHSHGQCVRIIHVRALEICILIVPARLSTAHVVKPDSTATVYFIDPGCPTATIVCQACTRMPGPDAQVGLNTRFRAPFR